MEVGITKLLRRASFGSPRSWCRLEKSLQPEDTKSNVLAVHLDAERLTTIRPRRVLIFYI